MKHASHSKNSEIKKSAIARYYLDSGHFSVESIPVLVAPRS